MTSAQPRENRAWPGPAWDALGYPGRGDPRLFRIVNGFDEVMIGERLTVTVLEAKR